MCLSSLRADHGFGEFATARKGAKFRSFLAKERKRGRNERKRSAWLQKERKTAKNSEEINRAKPHDDEMKAR